MLIEYHDIYQVAKALLERRKISTYVIVHRYFQAKSAGQFISERGLIICAKTEHGIVQHAKVHISWKFHAQDTRGTLKGPFQRRMPPAMLSIFVVLVLVVGSLAGTSPNNTRCLCTYGEPCWPTADQFAELESQVSQPLIYPVPTASACYPVNDPSGNCTEVVQDWTNGNWRSSMPGSMEAPNFETFMFKNGTIGACYLNTSLGVPCERGSVPVIGVDARTPQVIQAAISFALQHALKLVVKNTGHDFLGRSTARGAFVIWTHNMKSITFDAQFTPRGAPANETYQAVIVGAGVQWYEAYDTVNQNGRMMVGGASLGGSVGAGGGWLQGGGHSALSPTYGLGTLKCEPVPILTLILW